jgi:N-methylhydantoinase B
MPNVEDNELFYPFLYLWRKELPDSGGAGKFRGGNSAELALVPHKTDVINLFTITSELAVPGPGLFGGYPSSTNKYALHKGAKVHAQIAGSGRMPTDPTELGGDVDWVPAKSFDRAPTPDDVFVCAWAAASGYGDPLDREPQRVADDVAAGRVTAAWGAEGYGVVLAGDGSVDTAATESAREALRRARLSEGTPWDGPEEER